MASVGGADEARAVVGILVVDLGAVVDRQLEQARVVADLAGGDQVRALLAVVLGVDVGTRAHERPRGGQPVAERRGHVVWSWMRDIAN